MMIRIMIGIAVGGGVGFIFGYLGKCASGTCPLSSNPYISAGLGALIGLVLSANRLK